MGFIQIVEFTTDKIDEMRELGRQYEAENGRRDVNGAVYKDRDREDTYLVIAEFDSYEAAMENSNRPETQALAEQMGKLASGPASYRNLDLVERFGS